MVLTFNFILQRLFLLFSFICVIASLRTRDYVLVIKREFIDSSGKLSITVNGTVPGPNLHSYLGEKIRIQVINEIFDDSTGIHWHGISQRYRPWEDGVLNITQCPIPNVPGYNTYEYEIIPERAGTFWYHGHYHGQYPDGEYHRVPFLLSPVLLFEYLLLKTPFLEILFERTLRWFDCP